MMIAFQLPTGKQNKYVCTPCSALLTTTTETPVITGIVNITKCQVCLTKNIFNLTMTCKAISFIPQWTRKTKSLINTHFSRFKDQNFEVKFFFEFFDKAMHVL